ncbi:MAG: N-acetylmuramoyl-L-alanine amidase [Beutenbergiaceae bacterium]
MKKSPTASVAIRWSEVVCAALVIIGLAVPAAAAPEPDATDWSRLARPLAGWTIAIDPGHNGGNAADPASQQLVSDGRGSVKPCNAVGTTTDSGFPEHAFTLAVAEQLRQELRILGARVILTRDDDDGVGPCVDVRGRFAEDVDADLMVSLHANGTPDPEAAGYFAIVSDPAISPSQGEPSVELATALLDALAEQGFQPSNQVDGALAYRDDLATLNFARRPAVLLELGEMHNPGEAALMETAAGQQQYADALADGVLAWASDRRPES